MALVLTEDDLQRWMRTLGPRLLALARGICRDEGSAEDVVQEAFVRLWNTPPDGPEQVVPSWMRRVVVNGSINRLRRRKHHDAIPEFSNDPALRDDCRPETQIDLDDNVRRVHKAMARLPEDKRALLVMKVYEEMTYEQIAEVLQVPVGTVMSRLNRARSALRDLVEQGLHDAQSDPLVFPLSRRKQG